jgi:creatinine amidohydrolase
MPQLRRGGVAAVSELGVLGDPTTATAAEGARVLTEMVEGCVPPIRRWKPGANGMLT